MWVLKTRGFARWARRERLDDSLLAEAATEIRQGLIDAWLGGGLLKKRVARAGGGKSSGYRTLLASNQRDRYFFMYGFSKNERDDVDEDELVDLKRIAKGYLALHDDAIRRAIVNGELQEINYGETQAS